MKVRDGLYSEGGGENFLPQLVAQGMKPYGTFFDNDNKNFKLITPSMPRRVRPT